MVPDSEIDLHDILILNTLMVKSYPTGVAGLLKFENPILEGTINCASALLYFIYPTASCSNTGLVSP